MTRLRGKESSMSMPHPDQSDPEVRVAAGRLPSWLLAVIAVAAIVALVVVLHLTGVVG